MKVVDDVAKTVNEINAKKVPLGCGSDLTVTVYIFNNGILVSENCEVVNYVPV